MGSNIRSIKTQTYEQMKQRDIISSHERKQLSKAVLYYKRKHEESERQINKHRGLINFCENFNKIFCFRK